MKVRSGFVSNSSSSSFVVSVPKDFIATKDVVTAAVPEDDLYELYENDLLDDKDQANAEGLRLINLDLDILKDGGHLYNEDSKIFWTIYHILNNQNMIVLDLPSNGGDGCDNIIPFVDKRTQKK